MKCLRNIFMPIVPVTLSVDAVHVDRCCKLDPVHFLYGLICNFKANYTTVKFQLTVSVHRRDRNLNVH